MLPLSTSHTTPHPPPHSLASGRYAVTVSLAASMFHYGRGTASPTPKPTPAPSPAPQHSVLIADLEHQLAAVRAKAKTEVRNDAAAVSHSRGPRERSKLKLADNYGGMMDAQFQIKGVEGKKAREEQVAAFRRHQQRQAVTAAPGHEFQALLEDPQLLQDQLHKIKSRTLTRSPTPASTSFQLWDPNKRPQDWVKGLTTTAPVPTPSIEPDWLHTLDSEVKGIPAAAAHAPHSARRPVPAPDPISREWISSAAKNSVVPNEAVPQTRSPRVQPGNAGRQAYFLQPFAQNQVGGG